MSVRSAQAITIEFITSNPTTQAALNADSTPTGTLVVNGTDNGASVTVTNVDTGRYKAAVTLPTLAVGDIVELSIAATVSATAGKAIVWRDTKDVLLDSSGDVTFANTSIATVTTLTNLPPITTDWLTGTGVAASAVTKVQAGLATPTNITAGTITTTTNLTNLPSVPTDWLSAAGVKADAVTKIQAGLSTYAGGDTSGVTTLLGRIGSVLTITSGGVTLADGVAHGGTPGSSTATLAMAKVAIANADNDPAFHIVSNSGHHVVKMECFDPSGLAMNTGSALYMASDSGGSTVYIEQSSACIALDIETYGPPGGGALQTVNIWNENTDAIIVKSQGGKAVLLKADAAADSFAIAAGEGSRIDVFNADGSTKLNLAQTVPTSNAAETVGDALNVARALGAGKWTLVGTTLKFFAHDGTTVVAQFALDSATTPTTRTPS